MAAGYPKVRALKTGIEITCVACKRKHVMEFVSENLLIQDGDESDEFRVDEGGQLNPQWCCRGTTCHTPMFIIFDPGIRP